MTTIALTTPITAEFLLAIALFCFASCATPGPNNLMLLASGVNYGFKRTLPHMMGINLGFGVMVFLIGLGLAQLFQIYPSLHTIMKWGSVAFMLYLSWKIATAQAPMTLQPSTDKGSSFKSDLNQAPQPLLWWQAALFQWINPKGWAMGLSAIAAYVPENNGSASLPHLLLLALMFVVINIPVGMTWTLFGVRLRTWLANDKNRRAFNYVMALLLVLSLAPMIWG
jgi:threonine/homoserine/homoserine lactone efflux protein